MNRCAVQKGAQAAREETSPFVSIISDRRDPVFFPKPRHITQLSEPVRPIRRHLGQQVEPCDSNPGAEVLDIILAKDAHGGGQVASSPPYFCGSPPTRAANPLVLDARFVEENAATQPAPLPLPTVLAAPSSSAGGRKGCCVRIKFGANPAAVRIEGFDCLDRGGRRGSCSHITAVA